ncbi:MAG: aryl-sulfate sulfotransferase, partial [Phycisphaerae bacterium]|nr:aryl-sulfate sulfotransferase [Phycisphaerae bacterium]
MDQPTHIHGRRHSGSACCTRALLLAGVLAVCAAAQESASPAPVAGNPEAPDMKRGLILNTGAAWTGYTLFAPLNATTTYLVDIQGQLVHSWPSRHEPGQAVYLLEDGSVLRAARVRQNRHFGGGGIGGRVERIAPDGTVVWEFEYANEKHCQHHDIEPLPNGNVLLIAWEKKTHDEVIAAGGNPKLFAAGDLWPDCVIEVEPQGNSGGKIVWEWHVWDHLIQEIDPEKPNHGVVAEHPERIDLNYRRIAPRETPEEIQRLRALGYIAGGEDEEPREPGGGPPPFGPPGGVDMHADWTHTNAVAYNARLDQIALSVHTFNEIWIIDHGTSTKEAAGHSGGRHGKGGDLLYRWGNPRAYGLGSAKDQVLFAQHDVRWIPEGSPGAGHLIVFNNGVGRSDGMYSSVVEFEPLVDSKGGYACEPGKAFGPSTPVWEYAAANKHDLFSHSISGAQRLPNGNTLVCSGEQGHLIEVTRDGKTVWEYVNPYMERRTAGRGRPDGPPPGRDGGNRPPGRFGPTTQPHAGVGEGGE